MKSIPKNLEQATAQLGKRSSLIVAHNTRLVRHGESAGLVYHDTEVVTYRTGGSVTFTSGGWHTLTTKERLNWVLCQHGVSLYQQNCRWYVEARGLDSVPFADGLTVSPDGSVTGAGTDNGAGDKKQKATFQRFAQLCADSLPLPQPSGGDCWYCCMVTDAGKTLGDVSGDKTDHLTSHIEEGYVVPSLVYNALKESGSGDAYFWGAFDSGQNLNNPYWTEIAGRQVKRSVYRYLLRRFGFAC